MENRAYTQGRFYRRSGFETNLDGKVEALQEDKWESSSTNEGNRNVLWMTVPAL